MKPNWYKDPTASLHKWRPMKLTAPKPRKTRKLEAVAKIIGEPDARTQPWIGARVTPDYWIQSTDGCRCLLTTAGDAKARQVGFSLGSDNFTVTDPEFFNAVKRALIIPEKEQHCVRFTVSSSWLILHSSWEREESTELFDIEPNGHTRDGSFALNAKYLLDALGSWPLTVTYDSENPQTPILLEFPEFAYLLAPLKLGKEAA